MTGQEIPEDVIEKAATRLVEDSTDIADRGVSQEAWDAALNDVVVVAPVIVAWAREQALAEAQEVVRGSLGFRRRLDGSLVIDDHSLLEDIAALRRKEGGE